MERDERHENKLKLALVLLSRKYARDYLLCYYNVLTINDFALAIQFLRARQGVIPPSQSRKNTSANVEYQQNTQKIP